MPLKASVTSSLDLMSPDKIWTPRRLRLSM